MPSFILLFYLIGISPSSFAQDYLPMVPEAMATAACNMQVNLDMNSKIAYILDPRNYVKESTNLAYLVLKQYNAMQRLSNADKVNEIFVTDYFERTLNKCPLKFTPGERQHFTKEIKETKMRYSF